jgi:hypothetical protein
MRVLLGWPNPDTLRSRHLDGHFFCTAYQSKDLTTTVVPYHLRILKFGLLHPIVTPKRYVDFYRYFHGILPVFQHSLPVFTKMCSERYEYRTAMCTVCIESPVGLWATWSLFCSSVIRNTLGYINGKECNCEEKLLFVWVKAETRVILEWSCRVVVLFYLVLSCDCLVWSCLASDCMQNVFLQHRPHQLPHSHDCVPLLHAHLTVACFVYPPSLSASVSIWTSRQ